MSQQDDLQQARTAVLLHAALSAQRDDAGNFTPAAQQELHQLATNLNDPATVKRILAGSDDDAAGDGGGEESSPRQVRRARRLLESTHRDPGAFVEAIRTQSRPNVVALARRLAQSFNSSQQPGGNDDGR